MSHYYNGLKKEQKTNEQRQIHFLYTCSLLTVSAQLIGWYNQLRQKRECAEIYRYDVFDI